MPKETLVYDDGSLRVTSVGCTMEQMKEIRAILEAGNLRIYADVPICVSPDVVKMFSDMKIGKKNAR